MNNKKLYKTRYQDEAFALTQEEYFIGSSFADIDGYFKTREHLTLISIELTQDNIITV